MEQTLFTFITRWFWVLALITNLLNVLVFYARTRRHARTNPELEAGYRWYLRAFFWWMSLPFLVMGLGVIADDLSVFQFFRPTDGNPYVIAFFVTVVVLYAALARWIYFREGAEFLATHPGLIQGNPGPIAIKLFVAVTLAGGLIAVSVLCLGFIPAEAIPTQL